MQGLFVIGREVNSISIGLGSYLLCCYLFSDINIMKRKCKRWWSTIPPLSSKRTITSYLHSPNAHTHTHTCWKSMYNEYVS